MSDNIFLSDSGLTSTSAQHIKDMAGHLVDNAKSKFVGICFCYCYCFYLWFLFNMYHLSFFYNK